MVTLRTIAERAGCTRSTVSLALRNHPHVAAETRARVQEIARELGWTPNAGLTQHMALVRGSNTPRAMPNLGILVNLPKLQLGMESTPLLHLEGAVARARGLGYGVNTFNLGEQALPVGRLRQIIRTRGIKALVFVATASRPFAPEYLQLGEALATGMVGWRCGHNPVHVARSNQFANTQLAMAALLARGFRRPSAVLPNALDVLLTRSFSSGVQAGQRDLPVECRVPPLVVPTPHVYVPESHYPHVRKWITLHRPDAILTTDVRSLVRCTQGWAAPFPLPTLYSLDYHPGQPVAGGVDEHASAAGAAGVDLAVAQLHRGESGFPEVPYTLQVEGHWVDAPAPAPAPAATSPRHARR